MTKIDQARPLSAAMDNVDAWRLGEIYHKARKVPAGDYIDTGLALRRLLEEQGYGIVKLETDPAPPFLGTAGGE